MDEKWRSWVTFGSVLMMIVGAFKFVSGIIGLFRDEWLIQGYNGYMLVDITGLAIWWIAIGAVLFLGGLAALQGSKLGRVVGGVAVALAAISEFFMIPYSPIWSMIMLVLYVIVLCAFVGWRGSSPYGRETQSTVAPEPATRSYVHPASDVPPASEVTAAPALAAPAVAAAAVAAPVMAAAAATEEVPVATAAPLIAEPAAVAPEPIIAAAPVVVLAETTEEPVEEPVVGRIYDLTEIEGIGPTYAAKLEDLGLKTTDDLLRVGATPKGREDLAFACGISGKLILRWVNMADLFRIKGVGEQYSDLLEAAGVDTVPELAQRRADNLTKKMAEVNDQKQLVRRVPTEAQVTGWIESAKGLPRVVTY